MIKIILIIVVTTIIIIFLFSLLFNSVDEFFKEANSIEEMIKRGDDKKLVYDAIIKLNSKSFHYQTGSRIGELAKMYEIKYNQKILI